VPGFTFGNASQLTIVQHAVESERRVFGVAFLSAKELENTRRILNSVEELDRRMACRVATSIRPCNGT